MKLTKTKDKTKQKSPLNNIKNQLKWLRELHEKPKTIKVLEENRRKSERPLVKGRLLR